MENGRAVTVVLLECEDITRDLYLNARHYVTIDRLVKTDKLINYRDQCLSVMGEFLLICYLRLCYGVENTSFLKGDRGKPYLKGENIVKFNISHTNNIVALAISKQNVGVDVESLHSASDAEISQLIGFCFSPKEAQYIESENNKSKLRFFEIWTRREAYFKFLGNGLSIKDNKTDIPDNYHFLGIKYKDYVANVCSDKDINVDLHIVSANDLIDLMETMRINSEKEVEYK